MSFRDDREAAHRRADALEQELKAVQRENATLRAPRRRRGRRSGAVAAVAGAVLVVGGAVAAAWMVSESSERAQVAAAARANQAALEGRERAAAEERAALERAVAAEREAAARPVPQRAESAPVRVVWRGSVDQAVGVALAAGAPCTIEGSFVRAGAGAEARELTVACGGQALYRSTSNGAHASLREGPVAGSASHEYLLSYRDEGAGRPVQATVSTLGHTATVWREGDGAMRVTIFVRDVSDAREGEAMGGRAAVRAPSFAGAVEGAARVTAVRGSAPVAAGARCSFVARPVWEFPENCRVALRCGQTWLYGAREAGYLTCEVRGGRPVAALDENTTNNGGDPRVTWRGQRIVVSDFTEAGEWSVDLAL